MSDTLPNPQAVKEFGGTVWFVSQVLGRHENSTGHLLAQLTEGLAGDYSIGIVAPAAVEQQRSTARSWVAVRMVEAVLQTLRLGWRTYRRARAGDIVVALTNPPLLPAVLSAYARHRGVKLVVLVHDVYPEALYAAESRARHRILAQLFDRVNTRALRRADRVIVIGRDMKRLLGAKLGGSNGNLDYIPNWPDAELETPGIAVSSGGYVRPSFVVQYSGKIGATHDSALLVEAGALLMSRGSDVRLQVFGWGAGLEELRHSVGRRHLTNVELHPPCARADLGSQLASCDVGLILMRRGMAGVSVPCRIYNLLGAGKPVIVAASPDSEVAAIVREARSGWVVDAGDVTALVDAICEAARNPDELTRMGARASEAAREQYAFARALDSYRRVITEVAGGR
jgi:colanic acid biosynthesis glycosyl transferase WcaI